MRAHLTLLLITLIIAACATSPTGRRQLMLVSEERAISASKKAYITQMSQLSMEGKLSTNQKLVDRVYGITGKLVAQLAFNTPGNSGSGSRNAAQPR